MSPTAVLLKVGSGEPQGSLKHNPRGYDFFLQSWKSQCHIIKCITFRDPGTKVNSDIICSSGGYFKNRKFQGS